MTEQLEFTDLPFHQFDLEGIRKARAAWERNTRTDIESPEWDQVSREWAERSQALAHMLFAKLDKLEGK